MSRPAPPLARRDRRVRSVHGHVLVDDYGWLRARGSKEVMRYLQAENSYTEAMMAPTAKLQEALYEEMLGRIREDDSSPPAKDGEFFYYSRMEEGKAYPIHCRKRGSLEADEEVLLDVNALADGHEFFEVGDLAVSDGHRYLAYSYDTDGDEKFRLVVKDLRSAAMLEDTIEDVYYSLAWAADEKTFFYTTLDDAHRPWRVHRHRLGTPAVEDDVVFEEQDERFFAEVGVTRSRRYLVITTASSVTSEAHVLESNDPAGDFRCFAPRRHEVEYGIDHRDDRFYVHTNLEAKNFRVMEAPLDASTMDDWSELVPRRDEVTIEWVDLFSERMVLGERENGLLHVRVLSFDEDSDYRVEMPEDVYTVWPGNNPEFQSDRYRFGYSSLVTPSTVFDHHPDDRTLTIAKREEVVGGHDPDQYETRRLTAVAPDGVEVPVSIVHRRGLVLDGSNPCLLYGYGSYGVTIDPSFSSLNLTLLDRGFVYAIAHVRGGAFLGETWHDDGKMLAKPNTFTDFIAVAERLISVGYTSPRRLAIRGGSAGGLLVGAALNLRPDLFAVALASVPFVDVVNTMLDETLPLTVIEYEEWGDPSKKEQFEAMLSYSPYDNVQETDYPAILVTAGLNDSRVQYWEPAKWVAKLRALKSDANPLLLKVDLGVGHGGPSGRYAYLRERAFEYAFLLLRLGVAGRDRTPSS